VKTIEKYNSKSLLGKNISFLDKTRKKKDTEIIIPINTNLPKLKG
jgi:hypothetical protein